VKKILAILSIPVLLIIYYLVLCPLYFDYQVKEYDGDGNIKNISIRFALVPIDGYTLSFEKFDLSKPFSKVYTLKNLPADSEPLIYLAVEDSNWNYTNDSNIAELTSAVEFIVTSGTGEEILHFQNELNDMVWSWPLSGQDVHAHGLYNSRKLDKDSHFKAEDKETYTLNINYHPDEALNGHLGFLYLRFGGSL